MQVFGFSYECYVPDTQILFPHVFLSDIQKLPRNDIMYRDCVNCILANNIRLAILPSNHYEFRNLIVEKFRMFLMDIGFVASKHKDKTPQEFVKAVTSLVQAKVANNDYPSDFLTYWYSKKSYFLRWLSMDNTMIRKQQYDLIFEVLEKFNSVIDHAEINISRWEKTELENEAHETSKTLKDLRDQSLIPIGAHEQDLEIISDCIVYRNHYLETGIIYLVTNDNDCFSTVKMIICFRDDKGHTLCAPGIDCIKPSDLVSKVKEFLLQKKSKTRTSSSS